MAGGTNPLSAGTGCLTGPRINGDIMRIFLIGQCTLHWGRMEFGNIGNYYILEPFVRELHRVFPGAEINTTFQLSENFCRKERISCVPMQHYYGWRSDDLDIAAKEVEFASSYNSTGTLPGSTPFIDEVLRSDLVIDFSGDIWGMNADLLGPNRFLVGLLKDKTVQLLKKPIALLAGSPGPFNQDKTLDLAREVFGKFDLVTNREPLSRGVLEKFGFQTSHVVDLACPAFLFESSTDSEIAPLINRTPMGERGKPVVGVILCGWNMTEGPFSKWPREDGEYSIFTETIRELITECGVRVCLMSHSNGFVKDPRFKLIHGRDFPVMRQFADILKVQGLGQDVFLLEDICPPAECKAVIRHFDMLVSGRIHGSVAGLSQNIPTVVVDYGHEPKAHKSRGFALVAGVDDLVADPSSLKDMREKVRACWSARREIRSRLAARIPLVQQRARENFNLLKNMVEIRR